MAHDEVISPAEQVIVVRALGRDAATTQRAIRAKERRLGSKADIARLKSRYDAALELRERLMKNLGDEQRH